jgi:hypothetical protein
MKCEQCHRLFTCGEDNGNCRGMDICVCNECYKGTSVICRTTLIVEDKKVVGGYRVKQK